MAIPNWPILSGTSCSCSAFCGLTPWFRWRQTWGCGDMLPSAQWSSQVVGHYMITNCTTFMDQPADVVWTTNPCCGNITSSSFQCYNYQSCTYGKGAHPTATTYLRYSYATGGASIDINIAKYMADNPTATTMGVTINPGWWYVSIGPGRGITAVRTSCANFVATANTLINRYYRCWWACETPIDQWVIEPEGVITTSNFFRTIDYTTSEILGSATGCAINIGTAIYDKDPNTAGATAIAGTGVPTRVATAYQAGQFPSYTLTIDLVGLGYSIV